MKSIQLVVSLLFIFLQNISAQESSNKTAANYVNVGVGINSFYGFGFPLSGTYERGIGKNIGAGVCIDYLAGRESIYSFTPKFKLLYPAIRASYHFNDVLNIRNKDIDLYTGVVAGYRYFRWTKTYGQDISGLNYGSDFFVGGYAGLRYYLGKHFGFTAEVGSIGSTNARVGVSLRF